MLIGNGGTKSNTLFFTKSNLKTKQYFLFRAICVRACVYISYMYKICVIYPYTHINFHLYETNKSDVVLTMARKWDRKERILKLENDKYLKNYL